MGPSRGVMTGLIAWVCVYWLGEGRESVCDCVCVCVCVRACVRACV